MGSTLITSLFIKLACIYNLVRSQEYVGCYLDTSLRMLGHYTTFKSLTSDMCIDYCQRLGYKYAGLQAKTKCFCGDETPANFKTNENDCNMECPGDEAEICGGNLRSSVYKINSPKKAYDYLGCYKDQTNPRALSGFYNNFKTLTPNECIELCKGLGYLYAGLQAGTFCYCGNKLQLSNKRVDSECNSRCSGDFQKKCGGNLRNSIYLTGIYSGLTSEYEGKTCEKPSAPANAVKTCSSETCTITCLQDYAFPDGSKTVSMSCVSGSWKPSRSDWSSVPDCKVRYAEYMGCYVDTGIRMLGHSNIFTAQTPDMCIDYCQKLGYKFAGLQAKTYCYCGVEAPDKRKTSEGDCNMECPGNKAERCGATQRNSVYKITNPKKAYEYLGCYKDQDYPRALTGFYNNINDLTTFQCITFCKALSYVYAGLQSGGWCYCGNQLQSICERVPESGCQSRCTGDGQSFCGGYLKNSIYFTGVCTTPCQNGGTCLSNNTCACPSNFYGPICQYKYCIGYPDTPGNSVKSCESEKCSVTCFNGYELPDGSAKADILCIDGEWEPAFLDCKGYKCPTATCISPCQNGGTCVSPNTCACTQDYYGTTCEEKRCSGFPHTSPNAVTLCNSEKCSITCLENYEFPDGSTTNYILCNDGKWDTATADCKAICNSTCQNGGTCVSPNTCACPENIYGSTCEWKSCVHFKPPAPANSIMSCKDRSCFIQCLDRYKFPDRYEQYRTILCLDGKWETAPDCEASCTDSCSNGGTCVFANDTCICPENYYGTHCERKGCIGYPLTPVNSIRSCLPEMCHYKCLENYELPRGATEVSVFCEDGYWITSISDWSSVPGCREVAREYLGCYEEETGSKMMSHSKRFDNVLTPGICFEYCRKMAYAYFGLQDQSECFCGYNLPNINLKVDESKCDLSCAGDSAHICGASGRNSVYKIVNPLEEYRYYGCYNEDSDSFTDYSQYVDNLIPFKCTEYCKKKGSIYAALQAGSKCFCGSGYIHFSEHLDEQECNMKCSGDPTKFCGGISASSVYLTDHE